MKELCQLHSSMALVITQGPEAGPWSLGVWRAGMQVGVPQPSGDLLRTILILSHFFSREKASFSGMDQQPLLPPSSSTHASSLTSGSLLALPQQTAGPGYSSRGQSRQAGAASSLVIHGLGLGPAHHACETQRP